MFEFVLIKATFLQKCCLSLKCCFVSVSGKRASLVNVATCWSTCLVTKLGCVCHHHTVIFWATLKLPHLYYKLIGFAGLNWTIESICDGVWWCFVFTAQWYLVLSFFLSNYLNNYSTSATVWWLEWEYLWRSWRRSAGARPRRAETDCGCGAPAWPGLWTCRRAGRRRRGRTEAAGAAGTGLRQWAGAEAGSSLPSAAPWFYWSRLGYPADSQRTTFVTREQASVESASLEEAMVPAVGWPHPPGVDSRNQQHPLSHCVAS